MIKLERLNNLMKMKPNLKKIYSNRVKPINNKAETKICEISKKQKITFKNIKNLTTTTKNMKISDQDLLINIEKLKEVRKNYSSY